MKGCVTVPGWVGGGVPWGIQWGHQRKGGLWISLKTVNFFVVTVQELEFSGREFQIPRPFTLCENFSLLA